MTKDLHSFSVLVAPLGEIAPSVANFATSKEAIYYAKNIVDRPDCFVMVVDQRNGLVQVVRGAK